ncbi:MAG: hypothetical protein Q7S40_14150 [Opitutaceae bacterium]|nr:hypothetical protein [Opitutaceae bacterium]
MKPRLVFACALLLAVAFSGSRGATAPAFHGPFGAAEWERSTVPVRPGEPGKAPFWNAFAKRFIFAPAFDYRRVENAVKYKYEIWSQKNGSNHSFESDVPYAPLSPVWASVPVGNFQLRVIGLSAEGKRLGVAGEGHYFRAAPFDGPYLEPLMRYDESALLALDKVMHKGYVEYWLKHQAPDPEYALYRYAAKMFGSVIVGAVTHARLKPGTSEAGRSIKLGRIVADYLISISFPPGTVLENFPPTYHGVWLAKNPKSHAQLENYMTIVAADSGHAYLDLYDLTRDPSYLEAAQKIARTYLKTQLPSGSWYLYLNNQTGERTADGVAIPTSTINYLERLQKDYGMKGLDRAIDRAFAWIMDNPVKTSHWLAQYEDVDMRFFAPYERMSREQTCDLAIYLFRRYPDRPEYVALAEDLIRFAEDQFLTWEQMEDVVVGAQIGTLRPPPEVPVTGPGGYAKNWLTPAVHEQYGFWMPSARNTGLMIDTYWDAYVATKKEVYLAKAVSIANNFTRVQKEHNGDYPTFFTKHPMPFWMNNSIYPAKVMMTLQRNLDKMR